MKRVVYLMKQSPHGKICDINLIITYVITTIIYNKLYLCNNNFFTGWTIYMNNISKTIPNGWKKIDIKEIKYSFNVILIKQTFAAKSNYQLFKSSEVKLLNWIYL